MDFFPGPNLLVKTAPDGDSTNFPASTRFVTTAIAVATAALPAGVSSSQVITSFISGGIAAPANKSYNIIEFAPFAITLTSFVGKLSTGTMTAYLSINAATVTGSTMGASSTQTTVTPSALNTSAIGSTLILTVSSNTSGANFSFMVSFNQTLTLV
jgi:hypothetical protein